MDLELDLSEFCCLNEDCPDYGKNGKRNIKVKERLRPKNRALLRCNTCTCCFSKTRCTIFFGLKRLSKRRRHPRVQHSTLCATSRITTNCLPQTGQCFVTYSITHHNYLILNVIVSKLQIYITIFCDYRIFYCCNIIRYCVHLPENYICVHMSLLPRPEGFSIPILWPLRRVRDMQGYGGAIEYFHNAKIT